MRYRLASRLEVEELVPFDLNQARVGDRLHFLDQDSGKRFATVLATKPEGLVDWSDVLEVFQLRYDRLLPR